jgi:soluble lytic murein transglycosylase-like protein
MAPDRRTLCRTAVLAAVGTALLARSARAEIYVYKDARGGEHFTNVPGDASHYRVYHGRADLPLPPSNHRSVAPRDRDPARYSRYDRWIVQAASLYQIPEPLVRAIIRCESDYDPRAVSAAGARGLMQLLPETAKRMNVRDILDPHDNILGGVRLLRELANEFHGDLTLTVAAYNAGDAAVLRFSGIPPFAETRDYVAAVTAYYRRYRALEDPLEASR